MNFLPEALKGLSGYKQFICYKLVPSVKNQGKMDKLPVNNQGKLHNAHDSQYWLTFDQAAQTIKILGVGHGVGFVLTEHDPFFCLDIDSCGDPATGTWSSLAMALITAFNGSAVEVSSSGKGLHILGTGTAPEHNSVNKTAGLEFYTAKRFIALTGNQAAGNILTDCSNALKWLIDNFFKRESAHEITDQWWSKEPHSDYEGIEDDDQLLNIALKSKSARSTFGGGASFSDLFEAKQEILARVYPDNNHACGYDENVVDMALAQHLAFWTGNNAERMLHLMQRSTLAREKWNRPDYLPRTIRAACAKQTKFLKLEKPVKPPTETLQSELAIPGTRFIALNKQQEFFKGCVYIIGEHKILVPGGDLLDPGRFKAFFGGHTFPLDTINERVTRNAWDAFTETQAFRHPRVHVTCFRPDLEPGTIIDESGRKRVNIWMPVKIPRKQGDISPFTNHLCKLIPNERDRDILMSYFSAIAQYPGVKFQWCPYLQGVEGNGKTLLTSCLAFAIGHRYCHFPKASELVGKHNSWEYGKILIGVEDLCLGEKYEEMIDALKPMITNKLRAIEPKFVDQFTTEVCANFIINSNHKDGLRKTMNDRRFAIFFTAQQRYEDLHRDEMLGEYFKKIFHWLEKEDGYAIVAEYFYSYPINPEFNPARGCDRAPFTSCINEAIAAGVSYVEQEILEAIGDNQVGFRNGWVSSKALDLLLMRIRYNRRIAPQQRRVVMQRLGYDFHPNLKEGRVTNSLSNGEGKPRLYTVNGHKSHVLTDSKGIAEMYVMDQLE